MRRTKLFCFPYAGGSAVVYGNWEDHLEPSIRLAPVELAGRGKRINEPFYASVEEAAEDVIRKHKNRLFDSPFAFYGHSMGGAIAYIVAQKLRERKYPQPVHIFFSGRGAPHVRRDDKQPYHNLPEDEFREKVLDLGGTPGEFFEHPELLEILLPLLRADFRISWLFNNRFEKINPLDCNITILTGKDEDLNPEQVSGWSLHTRGQCAFHQFEGGHFFINHPEEKKKLLQIINTTLPGGSFRENRLPCCHDPRKSFLL
jgi:surfactin synthase thioesterase subunit